MENSFYISILEKSLEILKRNGKSADIAALLISLNVPQGPISDLFIELSLAASPDEEEGVGCESLSSLETLILKLKNQS